MNSICKIKDIYIALYQFEKEFKKEHGITINEGVLLCCMKEGEPKIANELCEFVGLSNSRVSRVINSVESKGYIKRDMGVADRRQMIFTLTREGQAKIKEMQEKDIDFSTLKKQMMDLLT